MSLAYRASPSGTGPHGRAIPRSLFHLVAGALPVGSVGGAGGGGGGGLSTSDADQLSGAVRSAGSPRLQLSQMGHSALLATQRHISTRGGGGGVPGAVAAAGALLMSHQGEPCIPVPLVARRCRVGDCKFAGDAGCSFGSSGLRSVFETLGCRCRAAACLIASLTKGCGVRSGMPVAGHMHGHTPGQEALDASVESLAQGKFPACHSPVHLADESFS